MATIKTFEELESWQLARRLAAEVYVLSAARTFDADRHLRDQLRRAAVSVMANVTEGFERGGRREFVHFLSQAGGSLGELRSHLYVALDAGLVAEADFLRLQADAKTVGRLLGGLRRYLQASKVAGSKFRSG